MRRIRIRVRGRGWAPAAMAALTVLGMTGGALAVPDGPPSAHVRYGGQRIQPAHLAGYCWPNEEGAMGCTIVEPATWPKADEVRSGKRVRVRLHSKRQPKKLFVASYKEIDDQGNAEGDGNRINAWKTVVKRDGEVKAWDVNFRLKAVRRHYVRVIVQYPETAGYNVHLRVKD